MQRYSRSGFPAAALACLFALSACDTADRPTAPVHPPVDDTARSAAFGREAATLKREIPDEAGRDAALRDLMRKYGYPVPSEAATAPVGGEPSLPPGSGVAASPKSAATVTKLYTVRDAFPFGKAIEALIIVPSGATMQAVTSHTNATDPMLIGFYQPGGGGNPGTTRIIGFDDDGVSGTTDSYLTWTNVSGADRTVYLVAFAYSSASQGPATLSYRLTTDAAFAVRQDSLSATRVARPNPVSPASGCTGPIGSFLNLSRSSSATARYSLIAFNSNNYSGGYIFATPALLALEAILPRTTANFILGYRTTGTLVDYRGQQLDSYSCPG